MNEAMNDSAKHCEEQENVDEIRDYIGGSFVFETKKRKQMSPTVVQDTVRENPNTTYLANPLSDTMIHGVDSTRTFTMSAMKDSKTSGRITKRKLLQRKRTGIQASIEAINVPVPPTNTLYSITSTNLNEIWELILCTIKVYKK